MPKSEIVGIDPSADFITYAQKNAKSSRARFEVGDAQALKFEDASFDHVLALLVMNFIPDHNKAILEMRRVTRAQCIVSVAFGITTKECSHFASSGTKPLRSIRQSSPGMSVT